MLGSVLAQDPLQFPLVEISQLEYEGAFRISAAENGNSTLNFSQGPIEYNADNHSMFIVGHTYQQAIAEYSIPKLVKSSVLSELNMAEDPLQSFASILNRTPDSNPQNINRIGGIEYINRTDENPILVVNGYEYYDAPADNTVTTAIIQNSVDLQNSNVQGFIGFEGGAGHTSGWVSPIPLEWQELLEGDFVTGHSSGIPIIGRCSVGPSAFVFQEEDLQEPNEIIPTNRLLDFPYSEAWLSDDLFNTDGQNDIWTHLSNASYGFIVPLTRTYLTIGNSGGHNSGVCYKCEQTDGNVCGGYCSPDHTDNYQFYWLWDIADLVEVKNGELLPQQIRPYDYGVFETPFQDGFNPIGGGTFDPETGLLYLSIQRADREQGTYSNPPVIVAYSINSETVLATDWLDFQVEVSEKNALLSWSVVHDGLEDRFEIERSQDQVTWQSIGVKNANIGYHGSENYAFLDRSILQGTSYYRIKKVGIDGKIEFSSIRSLSIESRDRITISPNPAQNLVTISINNSQLSNISEILLYGLDGKMIRSIIQKEAQSSEIQIDISNLNAGVYFFHLRSPSLNIIEKIIKR